jgi:hypothetical protein
MPQRQRRSARCLSSRRPSTVIPSFRATPDAPPIGGERRARVLTVDAKAAV